jgi:hypothetical protein
MLPRSLLVTLLGAGLVLTTACTKKNDKPQPTVEKKAVGAATATDAARGFAEAAGRRDQAAMIRLLLNEAVCEAQPTRREKCLAYVKDVRALVPQMAKEMPKGFTAGKVELKDMAGAGGQVVKLALVHPKGGGNPLPIMVMEHQGRYYVGVGVKKKVKSDR